MKENEHALLFNMNSFCYEFQTHRFGNKDKRFHVFFAQIRQTKFTVIMSKKGSTKIVNFMSHGAVLWLGHIIHIVLCIIYLTIFPRLYLCAQIGQTKLKVIMTKEWSIKIGNFRTLGYRGGVLVLGHGHIMNCINSLKIRSFIRLRIVQINLKIVNFMTHRQRF